MATPILCTKEVKEWAVAPRALESGGCGGNHPWCVCVCGGVCGHHSLWEGRLATITPSMLNINIVRVWHSTANRHTILYSIV